MGKITEKIILILIAFGSLLFYCSAPKDQQDYCDQILPENYQFEKVGTLTMLSIVRDDEKMYVTKKGLSTPIKIAQNNEEYQAGRSQYEATVILSRDTCILKKAFNLYCINQTPIR